jgi:hypothetical protein
VRFRIYLAIVAAAVAVIYFAVPPKARLLPAIPSALTPPVRGVIHVHTRRSDGTGSVDQIAAAAARAGLNFVVFTDHGDAARIPDAPSYRSGVLCIDAVEISTFSGHLVALGLGQAPYPLAGEARDVIEDVHRLGGFSIAAHPSSTRRELRWTEWTAPFGGVEWLNGDSEWRNERPLDLARAVIAYPFRRPESLALVLDRPDDILRRWDVLARRRRVVGVAASDAHARAGLTGLGEPYDQRVVLHVPAYEHVFRTLSIALAQTTLSNDASRDARVVLEDIRNGRVYSTIDAVAGPAAFAFTAASGKHRAVAGEPLTLDGPVTLHAEIHAPADAVMSLLRDGHPVVEVTGTSLEHRADPAPAVYRVEVSLPGAPGSPPVPWILSNPVYVGRKAVEDPPPPVHAPATASAMLFQDGPAADWTIEHSPQSQGAVDAAPAVGGTQLLFRYALSGPASASPYAALVRAAGPQLAAHDRLTFNARADRPMRMSVQFRVPGGDRGERWHRSVYIDPELRELTVFFDDIRPRGDTSTVRPALAKIDSVLFVVDTVNTRPGTSGQIWLDDIRYER